MNKIFKIIFIVVLYNLGCSPKNNKPAVLDKYTPTHTPVYLQKQLKNYFSAKNKDSLAFFLSIWHNQIPAATPEFINQNDTLKNIFSLFANLYTPFKFGNYAAENNFNSKNEYVVIQNEIKYEVVSNSVYKHLVYESAEGFPNDTAYEFYKPAKTLFNFRPPMPVSGTKYLYLTNEYKQAINGFLALNSFKGDITRNDTIFKRYNFLTPTLPIIYGSWGGYWHIESFPIIDRIIFDANFEHAAIDFRYSFENTVLQYLVTNIKEHWQPDNKWLKIRME